jgi:hypothetical protein
VTIELRDTTSGRSISMRPIELSEGGDGSSWLVSAADLSRFDHVTVTGPSGVLATATIFTA